MRGDRMQNSRPRPLVHADRREPKLKINDPASRRELMQQFIVLSSPDVLDVTENRDRAEVRSVAFKDAGQSVHTLRGRVKDIGPAAAASCAKHGQVAALDEVAEITRIGPPPGDIERQATVARSQAQVGDHRLEHQSRIPIHHSDISPDGPGHHSIT